MKKICASILAVLFGLILFVPISKADQSSFQFVGSNSLPPAKVGQQYQAQINFAYSGTGSPSALDSGFPPGIYANPAITTSPGYYSINLSGTPTQDGNFTITVLLSDQTGGALLTQTFPVTVAKVDATNSNIFSINFQTSFPMGTVGVQYNSVFSFNYYGSFTPSVFIAGLPSNIKVGMPAYIKPGTGSLYNYSVTLSGVPTTAGSYPLSLTLSDMNGGIGTFVLVLLPFPSAPGQSPANDSQPSVQTTNFYNLSPLIINPATTTPIQIPVATSTLQVAGLSVPVNVTDPAGTNISSNGTVYMITTDGQRRPYTSAGAFLSYGFNTWANVVPASSADLALPVGDLIPPRDGKIICSNNGNDKGTCYLITDGKKAAFTSSAIFKALGFSFSNSLSGDVSFLTSAPNISSAVQAHPPGTLINDKGTIKLVDISGTIGIPSIDILKSWGYSLSDVVNANLPDQALPQTGILTLRTPGQLEYILPATNNPVSPIPSSIIPDSTTTPDISTSTPPTLPADNPDLNVDGDTTKSVTKSLNIPLIVSPTASVN